MQLTGRDGWLYAAALPMRRERGEVTVTMRDDQPLAAMLATSFRVEALTGLK
jgi:hypothetical protein